MALENRNLRAHTICVDMLKAIYQHNYQAALTLLNAGFDVDTEIMCRKYPIMICIEANNLQIAELFISIGCSLSLKDTTGKTPLHIAVELSNYEFVKLFIDNRADLTSVDDNGRTALNLAVQRNSLRMVEMLMEKATPSVLNIRDAEGKTPFINACCSGSDVLVLYFLDRNRGDVNAVYGPYADTPLHGAIYNNKLSLNTIKLLISAGADVNRINKAGHSPLHKAFGRLSSNNSCSEIKTLLQDVICLLIDHGADVNKRDPLNFIPLHSAVIKNNELLVRKLLSYGSHVNAVNDLGFTPLFYACNKGMRTITSLLIENGADLAHICYLIREKRWLWTWEDHMLPNSTLNYVLRKSKECQKLQNLCRLVIRKNLNKGIEKNLSLLPLPTRLIKFIQLVE